MLSEGEMGQTARQGLVILNMGAGKGKTTAALGVMMRAWGRGMKVTMFQFIKSRRLRSGEHLAAECMGVSLLAMGRGFTRSSPDLEEDERLARECWEKAKEAVGSGEYDIVILDELTYPLAYGWLDLREVLKTLAGRPPGQHVIITGRDAPEELIEFADLVTEMREVKHPFRQGIKGQPGIEF
jgi:cob(I)alamin adenosyltransferase